MVHKIEDLVEPFKADLNSINENLLTQPFVINKDNSKEGKNAFHHEKVMDFQYENCSNKYVIDQEDKVGFYTRQYFHYYRMRVEHFYPKIVENAKAMISDYIEPVSLGEVSGGKKCLVIGCLIKRMQNRMAVLKDFDKQNKEELEIRMEREENMETLALDTDYLELEDSLRQKVTLKGNVDHYKYVTGLAVGIYGIQEDNYFNVEKMIMPVLPPYIERPLLEKDVFVNTSINNVMPIGLSLDADKNGSALAATSNIRRYFPHLDIDMMPGETDPTSLMLPQQPLSKTLFEDPDLSMDEKEFDEEEMKENFDTKFESFEVESESISENFAASDYWLTGSSGLCPGPKRSINPVTNPYCFKIMGVEFHGTSGQNVNAFRKLTKKGKSTIEIMRDIIETGIIIPTAPDFTDCFPYNRQDGIDPLALDHLPHVFFAGNQKEFSAEMVDFGNNQKVCLISIPKYEESHSMVAINLRTFKISKIICNHRAI
uniref:DNA polymerase delta small subunit n=1 Tax=Panagrolaimus sp. PS1159 TaxID=55785 RepID=A0AC35FSX8_9BILA